MKRFRRQTPRFYEHGPWNMPTISESGRISTLNVTSEPTRRIAWNLLVISFIFSGFIWQSYVISSQYFKYNVVTVLSITQTIEVLPPVVTFCPRYIEAFNLTHLRQLPEIIGHVNESNFYSIDVLGKYLTIEQIFDLTPKPDDLLTTSKCSYHLPNSTYLTVNGKCRSMFKLKKAYKESYMCYAINFLENDTFSLKHLANTLDQSQAFYVVVINETFFTNSRIMMIRMHSKGTLARGLTSSFVQIDRQFVRHQRTGQLYVNQKYFTLTYSRLLSKRLPAPYITNCYNYSNDNLESSKHCYERCLTNKTIVNFGKVPFTGIIDKPLPFKHMLIDDIRNVTFSNQLTKLEIDCRSLCSRPDCVEETFLPKLSSSLPGIWGIYFRLAIPNEPDIVANSEPLITTIDYVTYILSCFSFWFSASPLQLYIVSTRAKRLSQRRRL